MPRDECYYCGSSWHIERDHRRAESRGGATTVLACRACNRSKGAKTLAEWLDYLKENVSYRYRRIIDHQKYKRSYFAELCRTRRK